MAKHSETQEIPDETEPYEMATAGIHTDWRNAIVYTVTPTDGARHARIYDEDCGADYDAGHVVVEIFDCKIYRGVTIFRPIPGQIPWEVIAEFSDDT